MKKTRYHSARPERDRRAQVYVDGADESNRQLHLIKGGWRLTREKIVAAASKKFICIADESQLVDAGRFPAAGGSDTDGSQLCRT